MKNPLLLAGLSLALQATASQAVVSLSRDGSGQGLLFPYATIEAGQSTLISIENPTDRAKAIKYHVRESREGHIAASGTAYVPAFGRWDVGLVDVDGIGSIALQPGTSGCSAWKGDGTPSDLHRHEFPDGQPTGVDFWPVATVSVDVVELGVLDADLTRAVAEGCSKIWSRWRTSATDPGEWTVAPAAGMSPPSGGLRGTAILIDVEDATVFTYPALGFNGLSSRVRQALLHMQWPYLSDIDPGVDELIHVELPNGERLRFGRERGIDAISSLIAAGQARAAFSVDDALFARTDVVIAMPTRHAYVGGVIDQPYNEESLNNPPKVIAPFTDAACETIGYVTRSATGKLLTGGSLPLCGPATVVKVRNLSGFPRQPLVADERALSVTTVGSGSLSLDLSPDKSLHASLPDEDGRCWRGLPVWVMALTAYEDTKVHRRTIATFPRADVASTQLGVATCAIGGE